MQNVWHVSPPVRVVVADGRTVTTDSIGTIQLQTIVEIRGRSKVNKITVPDVYYMPTLQTTLLSVSRLVHAGNAVTFARNRWEVSRMNTGRRVLEAEEVNGVYHVKTPMTLILPPSEMAHAVRKKRMSLIELHKRLGHLHYAGLQSARA